MKHVFQIVITYAVKVYKHFVGYAYGKAVFKTQSINGIAATQEAL